MHLNQGSQGTSTTDFYSGLLGLSISISRIKMLNDTLMTLFKKKEVRYNETFDNTFSLMQYVLFTLGALLSLALIFCICCFCMKLSDLKMKYYVMDLARRRGVNLDLEEIRKRNSQSPLANESCAIFVADVGIIA